MLKTETVLADLVGIPSVSSVSPEFDGPNRPVIDRLADYLDGVGCTVEVMPLPDAPGKANLIATLGSGEGGVVLAGHSDTVPYDESGWNSDPFALTARDARLHGLGAADMKGFIALSVALASRLDAKRLKHPLHLIVTADEESHMYGARVLVEAGRPKADYCIIGEPTDLKPVRMHKGILMEALEIHGRSGHSSDPAAAPNALDGLSRVLNALQVWREALSARFRAPDFAVPYPTLNFGHVHGGDNPNRICAEAELHIDLRLVPGMQPEDIRAELDVCVNQALAGSGCSYRRHTLFEGVSAFETAVDSRLVQAAERLSGETAQVVSFATEAGFFTSMGMETIVMGPGRISQAHQPNEYVEQASLAAGDALIEKLVAELTT
ncbi:MAG: acetylornithine deacetylase [Gammaproteobacteria bacterium]